MAELGLLDLAVVEASNSLGAAVEHGLRQMDSVKTDICVNYGGAEKFSYEVRDRMEDQVDTTKPVFCIAVEATMDSRIVGSQLTEMEIACPGLGGSILSAIDSASSCAFGCHTPFVLLQLLSCTHWMGWNNEDEAVKDWMLGADEGETLHPNDWGGITRADFDADFPTWSHDNKFVPDLNPPAQYRGIYEAARLLNVMAEDKAYQNHAGCVCEVSSIPMSFALRWSESDMTQRVLDDAGNDAMNAGYDMLTWAFFSNTIKECIERYRLALAIQKQMEKVIEMI